MNELYNDVDMNKLYFRYVGPTKHVNFYEYMDSKKLFNAIKIIKLNLMMHYRGQEEFLKKLNNVKMGKKTHE